MARRRKEIGITRDGAGWRVFVRVNGTLYPKRFALDTSVETMRAWRHEQITKHGGGRACVEAGSFAADVAAHLKKPEIARMPSVRQRAAHLDLWLDLLGRDRTTGSIQRDEIEHGLQGWLTAGLSPVTVYHRRTSIRSFFVNMRGTGGPVDGTTIPDHYRPVDRSVPFATLRRILEAMPAWRYIRTGIRQRAFAPLRVAVILHTGIPPAELVKLRARDFDRDAKIVRMPWRDKGAGTPAHTRELSAEGVAAFVALDAAGAWGSFPEEALSRSFKRAARRVCGTDTPIRLYDVRHSVGKDAYDATGDLATVGRLLGHVVGSKVTARYAMGANAAVDRRAIDAMAASRAAATGGDTNSAFSYQAKVTSCIKSRKRKQLRRVS